MLVGSHWENYWSKRSMPWKRRALHREESLHAIALATLDPDFTDCADRPADARRVAGISKRQHRASVREMGGWPRSKSPNPQHRSQMDHRFPRTVFVPIPIPDYKNQASGSCESQIVA